MTTATPTRNGAGTTEGAVSSPPGRNVHQRKLAVMAKCDAITLDADYNGQTRDGRPIRFRYVSIQSVSNHLRHFCAEEGIDVNISASSDGTALVLELVNADTPSEKIVSTWPIVAGDKAWAYTTKYALVRTFLIGDGEENDEADMAARSGETSHPPGSVRQGREASSATANQGTPPPARSGGTRPLGECVDCKEEGFTAKDGRPAVYWPGRDGKPARCNGYEGTTYLNHTMHPAGVTAGSEPPPYDDSDIPF